MTRTSQAALIAASLAFSALMVSPPRALAHEETHVSVDFGVIAFGYSDGYWDRERRWHRWRHHRDWERYREERREHAYDWHHDRDHDHGWRDHDRYWER